MGKYQAERFTNAKGQCDLVLRTDGKWFLLVTVDIPTGTKPPTTDFIGVDLGVINIAVDQRRGQAHLGEDRGQTRPVRLPGASTLGKASRGAKRSKRAALATRAIVRSKRKESRYKRGRQPPDQQAARCSPPKRTGRGIALERSPGHPRPDSVSQAATSADERAASFASIAVVRRVQGDAGWGRVRGKPTPATAPGRLPSCGHCDKGNRKSQSEFECGRCGHEAHADVNSARVIRLRANAAVNRRMGSERRLAG